MEEVIRLAVPVEMGEQVHFFCPCNTPVSKQAIQIHIGGSFVTMSETQNCHALRKNTKSCYLYQQKSMRECLVLPTDAADTHKKNYLSLCESTHIIKKLNFYRTKRIVKIPFSAFWI